MSFRLGVLTSGGDCSGLNACIRAITYNAIKTYNASVFGICNGTQGLIQRPLDFYKLTLDNSFDHYLRIGGTFLKTTNHQNPFNYKVKNDNGTWTHEDRSLDFIKGYKDLELDAFIGIGGDGSLALLRRLSLLGGLNFIAIPKTIDNDLGITEIAIGYATALDVVTNAIDHLYTTASSHHRVMVLEVMGRDAGHIALGAGISGGVDVVLIPEISYKLDKVCAQIRQAFEHKQYAIVVVGESVCKEDGKRSTMDYGDGRIHYGGIGQYLGHCIQEKTSFETRVTSLGHIQRGGTPVALDRIVANAFGVYAVDLVAEKKFDRLLTWQHRKIKDVPIEDAINKDGSVSMNGMLVHVAKSLGIYIGEV
jgi:6-phosphofructokinase 1